MLLAVVGVGLVVALAVRGFWRERQRRDPLTALVASTFGIGPRDLFELAAPSASRPPVVEP